MGGAERGAGEPEKVSPPKEEVIGVIDCGSFCFRPTFVTFEKRSYTGVEKIRKENGEIEYRCRAKSQCPQVTIYEKLQL